MASLSALVCIAGVLFGCINICASLTCSARSDASISCEKSQTVLALFVFSFISVSNACSMTCYSDQVCCFGDCVDGTSCAGSYCSDNYGCSTRAVETCCYSKCVSGSSCLGHQCTFDSDCSAGLVCCGDSKCRKSCLSEHCDFNSDCSRGQSCCSSKCQNGSCPCSIDADCKDLETCCGGICSKKECGKEADLAYIVGGSVGGVVLLVCCPLCITILAFRRHRKRRNGFAAIPANVTTNITATLTTREDGTEVLTEQITTSIGAPPVTHCNPLYQPDGPPSDQPPPANNTQSKPPPSYAATFGGTHMAKNSFSYESRKSAVIV